MYSESWSGMENRFWENNNAMEWIGVDSDMLEWQIGVNTGKFGGGTNSEMILIGACYIRVHVLFLKVFGVCDIQVHVIYFIRCCMVHFCIMMQYECHRSYFLMIKFV